MMKWLIPAAAFLLSAEVSATNCPHKKTSACFVTTKPSYGSTQLKQTDPLSYLSIESRQPSLLQPRHDTTALPMGIRSMLGLGKKKKDDNDREKSDNPKDIKAALEAIKADLEAAVEDETENTNKEAKEPAKKKKIEIKNRFPVQKKRTVLNPLAKEREEKGDAPTSATTYGETVRDRINRVKKGQMTEEEKAAFLNNALTSRNLQDTQRPRIRQKIPSPNSSLSSKASSSSSRPRDALWKTVMGNGSSSSGRTASHANINLTSKDDSAKREYLDMVTNPDRFSSYAAMGGNRKSSASSDSVKRVKEGSKGQVVDNLNMLDNIPAEEVEDGLASRLEVAAVLKEQQDSEARTKKQEEDRSYNAQLQQEQRLRSEEIHRAAEEKVAAQRESELNDQRREEEKRATEEKRIDDMQTAQDAYWAKKLEEENKRKERSMSAEEKAMLVEERKQNEANKLAASARAAAMQAEIEMLREEEKQRENPHEADILREAAEDELHEREKNAEIMEKSAAFTSRTVPQPRADNVSSNSFVEQQEKKKAALDEFMKTQNERLASLNSPLPFLGKKQTPKVEPKKPAKAQGIMPSLNLTDLTRKKITPEEDKVAPAPAPVAQTSEPAPRLNLAELTMAKKPAAPAPAPAEVRMPSLAEMTMLKRTETGGLPPSNTKRNSPSATGPSSPRPIRQNIPIKNNDDEDDEFFEYSRSGGNSGMSIKDIMAKENGGSSDEGNDKSDVAKQQSKMWGIDIDRFMD